MITHISRFFDEDLQELQQLIEDIFAKTHQQFDDVIAALHDGNTQLAVTIAKRDKEINLLEDRILAHAMQIIVKRQPMAIDMRAIAGSIRIASFAERMCDHCKNIAGRVDRVGPIIETMHDKNTMRLAELVKSEIAAACNGYRDGDLQTAFSVMAIDKSVDHHYQQLWDALIGDMGGSDADHNQAHAHMLLIGKHLERIGDLCKDVSKVTYFIMTGDEFRQFKRRRKAAEVKDLWQFYQSEQG
ncbi:MAG: phosphate signaling complex protein PhoU [Pseudomonadota bacterium]